MTQNIRQFLADHNFFKYQKFDSYLKELDEQTHNALSKHNQTQIHFPKKWESIKNTILTEDFIAIDLGGKYLRIHICSPQKNKIKTIKKIKVDFYENKTYTPTVLFKDIKKYLDKVLTKDIPTPKTLVFSFANALKPNFRKKNQLDGKILFWGKKHKESGLIGTSLGAEFEKFLNKDGYPNLKVYVINDGCTGLLSTNSSQKLPTATIISIIAGTGTNICVGYNLKGSFKLTNLEFGNFDFLPYSTFDNELNHQSLIPNKFRTEKLFSGAWQNQLFILMVKNAIKEGVIEEPSNLKQLEKMSSKDLEDLFAHKKLKAELSPLLSIWKHISNRGSFICALATAQIINYLYENKQTTKGITLLETGAILDHCEIFRKDFEKNLKSLLDENKHTKSIKIEKILTKEPTITGSSTLLKFCK